MTTLKEAVAQALDALTKIHPANMSWETGEAWLNAVQILREALAKPAPEPVADTESDVLTATYMLGVHAGKKVAQRKPLTDEEIHDCFQQRQHRDRVVERRMIARAIERAHGIGGEE